MKQKITEENAAAVYGILAKYFGPGGMTDALYKYMMASLIASTQGAINAAMTMGGLGGRDMSDPFLSCLVVAQVINLVIVVAGRWLKAVHFLLHVLPLSPLAKQEQRWHRLFH